MYVKKKRMPTCFPDYKFKQKKTILRRPIEILDFRRLQSRIHKGKFLEILFKDILTDKTFKVVAADFNIKIGYVVRFSLGFGKRNHAIIIMEKVKKVGNEWVAGDAIKMHKA